MVKDPSLSGITFIFLKLAIVTNAANILETRNKPIDRNSV